jgi:hypothetical protein
MSEVYGKLLARLESELIPESMLSDIEYVWNHAVRRVIEIVKEELDESIRVGAG